MAKDNQNSGSSRIHIAGNVQGRNVSIGDHNQIVNIRLDLTPLFKEIDRKLDEQTGLSPQTKDDVKAELAEIKSALETDQPDEGFLAGRFRNLKRMAPDITEVALETLKNPIGGVVEIVKKISRKISEETEG